MIYPDHQTASLFARERQARYMQEKAHERLCRPFVEHRRELWRRRLRRVHITVARAARLPGARFGSGEEAPSGVPPRPTTEQHLT